jgi:hypothetical protein
MSELTLAEVNERILQIKKRIETLQRRKAPPAIIENEYKILEKYYKMAAVYNN